MKPVAAILIALLAVGCYPNFKRTRGSGGSIGRTAPDAAQHDLHDVRAEQPTPTLAQP